MPSCIRPFRCGAVTAGADGIRKTGAQSDKRDRSSDKASGLAETGGVDGLVPYPSIEPLEPWGRGNSYQGTLIMTHRDRVGGSPGRRKVAGDAAHPPSAAAAPLLRRTGRQNFSTPSDGPHTRPQRRLTKAFGRRRARFAMPRIATAHA